MRAAVLNPENGIVINVLDVSNLWLLPNLVPADSAGNIGDWWTGVGGDFAPLTDPRHPHYVIPGTK